MNMKNKKLNRLLWQYRRELKFLKNFSADTIKTYISCVNKYFDYAESTFHINPLYSKVEHLFEFLIDLKKSVSPSRQTHYRAALRRFFTLLYRLGEINKNPAKNLLPVKRIKSQRYNHIPVHIVFNLLSVIDIKTTIGFRDRLMILLLWCLGLRSGEMRLLIKNDIKIIDQEKKIALVTINGKGTKQRALMAVDKLFDLLTNYIKPLNGNDLLFPDRYNQKPMDDSTVNKRIKKYAYKANISIRITAHCLRHSFATEMYYANVPLEAIRTMLGHENLRETSVYIHVTREDKISALSLLSIRKKTYAA
jgi:integrase/recombinase XerD